MKYLLLVISIFSIFVWTGCGIIGGSKNETNVTFRTNESSYALGSTVTAVLQNESNNPILYNLCSSKLEKKNKGDWNVVGPYITCPAIAKILKPGGSIKYKIALDDSITKKLKEGLYRIRTNVEIKYVDSKNKNLSLTTNTFSINTTIQQ